MLLQSLSYPILCLSLFSPISLLSLPERRSRFVPFSPFAPLYGFHSFTGKAKQLVDKFSRAAREKGQPFTDFESEGLLYVTVYDENNLVYCIPIFSFKDNKKIDLKEIEYISEDAKRMENILRNSNEKRKEIEKDQ